MPLLDSCKRWRFLILWGMLLVLLVVQPIVFGFSASPVWFDASFLLVTVALLFSFSLERKWRTAAYALGILSALLSMGGHLLAAQDAAVILLVGHLPYLNRLTSLLIHGDPDRAVVEFLPATMVCCRRVGDRWSIDWTLPQPRI